LEEIGSKLTEDADPVIVSEPATVGVAEMVTVAEPPFAIVARLQ
jgi:hypothetical protein